MESAWTVPTLGVIIVLVELAVRVAAIIVIPINRRPQTTAAWLLARLTAGVQ